MIPTHAALGPPYQFNWSMHSPLTGAWTGNGFVSSNSAASATEAAAHAAPTSVPPAHAHAHAFHPTAPGFAQHTHHTVSFPDFARREFRHSYRSCRRGPRVLPLLVAGGLGAWGYSKVRRHVWRLESEIDTLGRQVDALQLQNGGRGGQAVGQVGDKAAAGPAGPGTVAPVEPTRQDCRRERWGGGPHGDDHKRWEKSWSWSPGSEPGRV